MSPGGVQQFRLLPPLAHNRWARAWLVVLTQMMFEDDKKGWECNASGPFLNDNELIVASGRDFGIFSNMRNLIAF